VFGAEAAARHYYDTSAAYLDVEQAARLAAMVRNRATTTGTLQPALERRIGIILERMYYVEFPEIRPQAKPDSHHEGTKNTKRIVNIISSSLSSCLVARFDLVANSWVGFFRREAARG